MKKGTLVKLSQEGLDYLFPVQNHFRERAAKKRFLYCGPDKKDLDVVRVKRLTSASYAYYHKRFIEAV